MAKQSKNATSGETQEVESKTKDISAKKENIESPKEEGFNLTEEQWSEVFKHPRFTELNEKAKQAEKELARIEKEKDQELQKKLKEEGKLEELLEEKEKELERLTSNLQETQLNNEVMSVASKLNVVDTDAVVKLLDKSKLETGKDGNYLNVESVVSELISEKPYLANVESNVRSDIGGSANASTESQSGDVIMTKSELRENLKDHNWYVEHKEDIAKWEKEGRIDYSR
jgi:predicted RNase H-like nuclease (RuvC/YqgF family)